jgi:hypothetical protein
MYTRRSTWCALLLLASASCGLLSPEKKEAKLLSRAIVFNTGAIDSANKNEALFMQQVGQWSGSIAFMGFPLSESNPVAASAQAANQFMNSANSLRSAWQSIAGRFQDLAPKSVPAQVALSEILTPINQHVQMVSEMQQLLNNAAGQLSHYQGDMFSHPTIINTIADKVKTYSPSPDRSSSILADLRIKYNLAEADLH